MLLFAQDQVPAGFRAYPLEHARSDAIGTTLREMLSGLDEEADVRVDPKASRLLVRGSDEAHRLTAEIIKALDRPSKTPAVEDTEKKILKGYTLPAAQRDSSLATLRDRYRNDSRVRLSKDPRTSQLLVLAPPSIQREIGDQLKASGRPLSMLPITAQGRAESTGQEFVLQHITWQELEDEMTRLWGNRASVTTYNRGERAMFRLPPIDGVYPLIEINRRENRVSVKGPGEITRPWLQLLSAIDSPRRRGSDRMRLVPLHRADPQNVHRAVSLIKNAEQKEAQAAKPPQAAPINRLAFQQPPAGNRLRNGNGDAAQDDEGGLIGQVQIEFIPELGIFVVKGHERDVARVMKIIEDIEKQSLETKPEIEIYSLRHANSQAIGEMINELYQEVFSPRHGDVSITALIKPNALLLIGRREALDSALELIDKLDVDVAPNTRLAFFRLKFISAVDAETKINTFYETGAAAGTGTGTTAGQTAEELGLDVRVRVIADYRSNTLIVQASPRDLSEVQRLLEGIDVETSQAVNELRMFQLKNSLASELAPVLQEAFTGQAAGGAQPGLQPGAQPGAGGTSVATARSVVLQYMNLDESGKKMLRSGILADIRVTADPNSNTLMVHGPTGSMELIAAIVKALDQLPAAEAQIKIYHIENGDATNLQIMLQQLFGQATTGQGAFGQAGIQQAALQTASAGDSSLVSLRFAVDLRTNTVIASGSAGDLEVVEAILARLDEADIEARRTVVYRLKNAPSDDVAQALTNLLQQQTQVQQFGVTQQLVSPFEQIEREVIVVSEPVTNSLLLSATPRYFEQIRTVIEELDVRPPMVMIQVLIAEVRLTDNFEFGVELGIQDSLLFDRGLASVGFPFNNVPLGNDLSAAARATRDELAGQGLTSFALGRSSPGLGYGGLVLSAANESISVLVRALQDEGKLQILSRPQIMTLDNQPAFVQVGARVPRITSTNLTPQGGSQNTTSDEDVGLLLRVQPRISPDGQVVMLLDTEKSEVGPIAQGIPIAIDSNGQVINSPQINTTTAQTTISARSGQTVVFAGLITETHSSSKRGVPWISDVPVLGRLFEFEVETEERTELLIIMTPYIVKDEEDYEMIKAMESQRMSWSLADVARVHGEVGLSGGQDPWGENVPIIYPDEDPSASEFRVPQGNERNVGTQFSPSSIRQQQRSTPRRHRNNATSRISRSVLAPRRAEYENSNLQPLAEQALQPAILEEIQPAIAPRSQREPSRDSEFESLRRSPSAIEAPANTRAAYHGAMHDELSRPHAQTQRYQQSVRDERANSFRQAGFQDRPANSANDPRRRFYEPYAREKLPPVQRPIERLPN